MRLRERVLVFRYVGFVHACHVVVCVRSHFPSCWFAVNVHPDVPEVGCLWQFVYSKCSFFVCVLCRCFLAGLQQRRAQGTVWSTTGRQTRRVRPVLLLLVACPRPRLRWASTLDSSSSSMEEIVEEEVPEVRRPKTPPTPPEEHALSSASEEDTKKGEPVHTRGRSPAKAAPPGEKGRSPRSSNPTAASSGKGRGRDEYVKRRYCWRRVKRSAGSRAQHEFWNLTCLQWQFAAEGHSWRESGRLARACKARREREEASPPRLTPAPAPAPTPAPAPAPVKSPKEKRARDKVAKDPKDKKNRKEKKAREVPKPKEKKKEKSRRKRRPETSSPTPVRAKRKRPRSSDSESDGKRKKDGRGQGNAPRTLVINLPRNLR